MIPCNDERQIGKFENSKWTTTGKEFGRHENDISSKLVNKASHGASEDIGGSSRLTEQSPVVGLPSPKRPELVSHLESIPSDPNLRDPSPLLPPLDNLRRTDRPTKPVMEMEHFSPASQQSNPTTPATTVNNNPQHSPASPTTSTAPDFPALSRHGATSIPPDQPVAMTASGQPALNPRSCVTCRRRKVRCDKQMPCSNCRRAVIQCIFPAPGP
ncbi:fungal specific transcription factor domain-containing protein, partial [Colletotrichum chrysophilum]